MIGDTFPPFPRPDTSGAGAAWTGRDVLVAPFNDLETTRTILKEHGDTVGAVIVEPLHRCITPLPGFLPGLREITHALGIVLVFDEVVTGFRLALGGAQEYYGVEPDLVAYGKALGGGFPIGAFGGRSDIMEVVDENRLPGPRYVWSASTSGGNPVSCAAALAMLDILSRDDAHSRLHASGKDLRGRMASVLQGCGITGQILGDGPLAQVAFSSEPVIDYRSWKKSDARLGRRLMLGLLGEGIFLNPMGTKLYLSLAHQEEDLDRFEDVFSRVLRRLAEG